MWACTHLEQNLLITCCVLFMFFTRLYIWSAGVLGICYPWVRISVTRTFCEDLTDMTLAYEDINSIPTDDTNRQCGNVSGTTCWPNLQLMQETPTFGQTFKQCKWRILVTKFWTNVNIANWCITKKYVCWPLWLEKAFIYGWMQLLWEHDHDGKVATVALNGDDTSLVPLCVHGVHCVHCVPTLGMNWWDRDLTELICCLAASLLCHTLV